MLPSPASGTAIEVWVAPHGSDVKGDGTRQSPFASARRARDAVRILRYGFPRRTPATVWFAAGTYFLTEALRMGPEDSYTTYSAIPGEQVTLSGGVLLNTSWARMGRLVATKVQPGLVSSTGLGFTTLYVNGLRRWRARTPNVRMRTDISSQCTNT